ncbi:predicted protein [Naegleria gruberi]|uniref:Predicted protein n=1 Tax=Naegleria gruberi TaxID=5762 RepID=D2VH71_NAEGR|nr:uncharacterized protein NAEGRDRAFT_79976 [Naegleria gruberi]EFC43841.1 predicted protein [Naegleria gruberi]|eukprot:XP_002676585.1 predicted protein [Naegleria gruberi strain NEG-M]
MKRLFITTFFPSSNVPSSTSCSKSLPSSSAGGFDFLVQILRNKGITDSFLLEINDVSTLQTLARDYGLPFEPLQKYHQNLLKNKPSNFEPIRHNSNQASILTSPSRSSSLLSSLMNDSYLEEGLDDESTSYSSRSASISIPSSHSSSASIVKSFGTISSSIDEHFFDDDKEKMRKPITTNDNRPTTPVNYEAATTSCLSQEEKAKKELENILDIIHDNNYNFPKSALVAAFRKTINEGRLPSSPALNPTSPSSPSYKSFMFNDVDSDSEYDDSPTSPVL